MHITIAGKLGSGKSTVCKILQEKHGFEIYSTGKIQRKIAEERGLTTLEMNELMCKDNSFDFMIDDAVAKISRETTDKSIIFDSRMAWHFAANSFRVFMYVDPTVSAERVYADDTRGNVEKYKSIEDARDQLLARSENENTRFKEIYHVDNFDYNNYDLIIDTSYNTPENIADLIYDRFVSFKGRKETEILLSPKTLVPDEKVICEAVGSDKANIALDGHYNHISPKSTLWFSALSTGAVYVNCRLLTEDDIRLTERETDRKIVFEGRIFKTAVCRATLPDGTPANREIIVHSGGVGILPIDSEGYGYFVKQYRYGAGKILTEVPAGKLEAGEDPLEAAKRELSEETGFTASKIVDMGIAWSSPAILTEKIHMYLALGLTGGRQHLDTDEHLDVLRIKLEDAYKMVLRGEIEDGKSQILIMRAYEYIK